MSTPAINAYLRHRIEQWVSEGKTIASLAREIGVSGPAISQIRVSARGVGLTTLQGFARLFGMSLDELLKAADAWVVEHPDEFRRAGGESHVETPERYPNRTLAAEFARRSGVMPEAIALVESWALKSETDPSPMEWLEDMKAEERRLRRGAPSGRVLTSDDDPTAPKKFTKEELERAREDRRARELEEEAKAPPRRVLTGVKPPAKPSGKPRK